MIVNNVRQAALVNAYAGDHWFVVVWRIFPRSSGGPSVVPSINEYMGIEHFPSFVALTSLVD